MLKKTIKYTDYNGTERTEDFFFNISKAEIAEMEMNESQLAADGNITGGLEEKFDTIKAGGKGAEILAAFKDILFMAYGEKSDDGRRFMKSADRSRAFAETEAYSVLFMELISDEGGAATFMNGVLPFGADGTKKSDRDKPVGARPMSPNQRAEEAQTVVESSSPDATPPVPTEAQIQAYLEGLRGPVRNATAINANEGPTGE